MPASPSPLAPSNNNARLQQHRQDDLNPFASNPITYPTACARPNTHSSPTWHAPTNDDARAWHSPDEQYYKSGSISSSGGSSAMTPINSLDLEKASIAREALPPPSQSRNQDPEKAMSSTRQSSERRARPPTSNDRVSVAFSEDDEGDDGTRTQSANAVKILLFMSGPVVGLSVLNAFWTFISLLITLCSQPVRVCAKRPSFGLQLAGLIGPALNLQLGCIYTPLPPYANEDSSYHVFTLTMVHLMSPFISVGMMVVAWVVAVYWASSAVVGDPSGLDKRDDGKETALGLRGWWEALLLKGVKEE